MSKSESKELSVQQQLKEMAERQQDKARPTSSYISTRGGALSYAGQPLPDNQLDCIILTEVFENALYLGAFDANNPKNPDCYALGTNKDDMVPHPDVEDPVSKDCASCPNMEWGSAEQGRGKACKNIKRLAVIPESSVKKGVVGSEVACLKLPVMSVKNWDTYSLQVTNAGRPSLAVVTQISTTPDPKSQYRVTFKLLDKVDIDDAELVSSLVIKAEEAEKMLLTPYG